MTDPVLAIIEHEIGKLQTLHAFKMSGIVHPPRTKLEGKENGELRSYNNTLKTIVKGYEWLRDEHEGKKRRKELQEWANILYRDGHRNLMRTHYSSDVNDGEAHAYMNASKAIIDSFKQL